ncbi:MAG: hypothetical protein ACJAUP_002102 [Cellvibrionaceae bacterium]|jgi:hypothetical protein
MKANCFFAKKHRNSDQVQNYYHDMQSHVVTIVGGAINQTPIYPLVKKRSYCSNSTQAIIIKDNVAKLSSRITEGFSCAGIGSDEKEYRIFSHPFSKKNN